MDYLLQKKYSMINKKYEFYIFSFLVSLFMSLLVSGVVLVLNIGLVQNFLILWMNSWLKAFIVAFPSVLIVIPFVRKIVSQIIKKDNL